MIELFTPESMRKIDAKLIGEYGIPGVRLMENAAEGVAGRVRKAIQEGKGNTVFVLCGPGNNGGDGFAVSAILHAEGVPVYTVVLTDESRYSGDAAYELQRAKTAGCFFLSPEEYMDRVSTGSLVVDAVFGTGLSREVTGTVKDLIERTNASGAYIIAADIPSGLSGATGTVMGTAIHACETVTFQKNKIGLLSENGRMCTGEVLIHQISDIDTHATPDAFCLEEADIARLLPERPLNSHKGKNGKALLIGGSARFKGAVKMCAAAALRAGCGVLTVAVPGAVAPAMYDLPEACCLSLADAESWDEACCKKAQTLIQGYTAIAIGPGMGKVADSGLFEKALTAGTPVVIDADGVNHISARRELIGLLHKNVVLTPHPMELARLLDCELSEVLKDTPGIALRAAKELNAVVLLKGATSYITEGTRLLLNITGNPGLAKGGSGDVLTGLILAMLSQGLEPLDAACVGSYLLGASADRAVKLLGNRMLLARDVIGIVEDTANGFNV